MAAKVEKEITKKKADSPFVEVELLDKHTHQGEPYQKGDKITVRKRQLQKLREWGKIK